MQSLILHPTSTAQWHALLMDAQKSAAIHLKEDLESYLVFLLMRFTSSPQLAASVLGLEFLSSYERITTHNSHQPLQVVGDKCLLFAGLFPGRAIKRRVKISYFVKLGQTAYAMVSNYTLPQEALFIQLCQEFPRLMDVLHAMREKSGALDLIQSFELWHETGSHTAWQRLCEATEAMPVPVSLKKPVN